MGNGAATFTSIIRAEIKFHTRRFWSNLVVGPGNILTAVICYIFSRKQIIKQVIIGFILCSSLKLTAFFLYVMALYEAIQFDAKIKKDWRTGRSLCNSLYSGITCSLVIIVLGQYLNHLKEEALNEKKVLFLNQFKCASNHDPDYNFRLFVTPTVSAPSIN